ncbi:MAG: sigma-54-dependent Fis family transcriptional regulator [Holophaga sp.]|nr:sigma-54-dependent Fis family transcriptional regulator [Holophaga sp.]
MDSSELDLRELLQVNSETGLIHFSGQRAILLDAVALGILRKELIQTLGMAGARGILTRFGYAHGWRTAESIRGLFPQGDLAEWHRMGARLHSLQGMVKVDIPAPEKYAALSIIENVWHDSYEAEQHLLHLGQAEEAVCWTLCGFASGYLSCCHGKEILCVEDRCRGKGDAVCHVIGRAREDWGEAAAEQLSFYHSSCLNEALTVVTAELKRVEQKLLAQRRALRGSMGSVGAYGDEAQSPAMVKILEMARRVAKADATVLITGESGVGKERIARLIHDESPRLGGPFLAINCGAVPESLLESELFGHAKGAFTGATQDRLGLFEAAQGGTLLLDEVGEIPPPMQVKLLRALQEKEVRRVGENRSRPFDVRVLAATNRDLAAEVNAARFRQDLYYRLHVIELKVPALRQRREDILALARHFLGEAAARAGSQVTGFTPKAAHQLLRYGWPGNVRELENAVERAVVMARGSRIDLEDLPDEIGWAAVPVAPGSGTVRSLEMVERDTILAAVQANHGNKVKAASQLQIGAATLYRKLAKYEAKEPEAPGETAG